MPGRSPLLVVVLPFLASLAACAPKQPTGADRGRELFATCAVCHGANGQGRPEYEAPAIAGLDAWYVAAQLGKFRAGARGAHPDDVAGLRMRPMSRTLSRDSDVTLVADYVSHLAVTNPAPTLAGGDAGRGRALFSTCAQCHGEGATGNREKNAPPLNHQSDWYIVAQLQKFKAGIRGTNAADVTGAQMRPMALGLADDQAMLDVAAYIATLPD